MDVSCSLDVLVRQDAPFADHRSARDPMAEVLQMTQQRIEAAFGGHRKVAARRKRN
jgi:hypothetical protein